MATLRDIRRRISGIKSTQKITKAMKMVAAAKLRRAQDAIVSARPYARKMRELLLHLSGSVDVSVNPLFATRPVSNVAIIVVTADRGLCGAFNSNVIRAAVSHINTKYASPGVKVNLICVGRKSFEFFSKRNYHVVGKHVGIFSDLQFSFAESIVAEMTKDFLGGTFDRIEIVYNEFRSIVQQRIVIEQVLPVSADQVAGSAAGKKPSAQIDYIYEPVPEEIIAALLPRHLNFHIWRALLESNAAEQGARMTAMENATTNASDLLRDLQLSYNKARQASITKELLEIVSGAEALKAAG